MEDRMIRPESISGVNPLREARVEQIAASMREKGWTGPRLLVEQDADGRYAAWTGSHRIEAAKIAGLREIPCRVITPEEGQTALARLPDAVGYATLRQALTNPSNGGGKFDPDRLAGLRRIGGFDEAAAMLEEHLKEWDSEHGSSPDD